MIHYLEVENKFWNYTKTFIEKPTRKLETFTAATCSEYFRNAFRVVNHLKTFCIPELVPKFNNPKHSFNLNPPTYCEVTKIVKRMKSSGSPCPLDQISDDML